MNDKYLSKLHNEILSIVDYFHSFCDEHHLKYYMVAGSLLGSVRHKGFIPWDDDFDVCMPRKDFEKFIKIFPKKSREPFYLNWINTNKKYNKQFAKICKSGTLFQEIDSLTSDESAWGIFIDIFPLDVTSGVNKQLETRRNLFFKMVSLQYLKIRTDKKDFKSFLASLIPSRLIFFLEKVICNSFYRGRKTFYTRFGSQYSSERITTPVLWYGDGKLYLFEGRKYYGPDSATEVLKKMYGEKYMEIPPKEKRRTHHPHKIIFSDGEIVSFDNPSAIIPVEETLN